MSRSYQFLRPTQLTRLKSVSTAASAAHLRFYSLFQDQIGTKNCIGQEANPEKTEVIQRLHELQSPTNQLYPRLASESGSLSCSAFAKRYEYLKRDQSENGEEVVIRGRVNSFRAAGSKLLFIDIGQERHYVQGLCNFKILSPAGVSLEAFNQFYHRLQRGDIFSFKGIPHRTSRGELSVIVTELPRLLSPCLHRLPTDLLDRETRIRKRHVDLLVNQKSIDTLRLRSEVLKYMRKFLMDDGHVEVQTPILGDGAGGAVARPFYTSASEFPGRQISLRIAPELWLKRLILGGFERVFEIGPCFRNEGLDPTHNPEFTTCEFYRSYTDLEELIRMTESMFLGLTEHVTSMILDKTDPLHILQMAFTVPFGRLDFIPAIESAINRRLPDLTSAEALSEVGEILRDCNIPLPASPTLPRFLDKLCAVYIEPQCTAPTFIINHPECLSPLSKSFDHPDVQQRVSARAELFIDGQEIVNMYEEENSPLEQRRKFLEQLQYRDEGDSASIDQNYIEALEWGLPPTGGWGCGIDRLCMLLSGTTRIGDVLAFGTLRNVIALGGS